MPLVRYTTRADTEYVLRLKDLLGGEAVVRQLQTGHPLGPGFAAHRRRAEGAPSLIGDDIELSTIANYARTLFEFEPDWQPHRERLVAKLRSTKDCDSILFELAVGNIARTEARELRWAGFDDSTPDWIATSPRFEIECKFSRRPYKVGDYQRYLTQVAEQHSDRSVALIAAVGFAGCVGETELVGMRQHAKRHLPWMTQHPHVSAVLVFGQERSNGERESLNGVRGFRYSEYTVISIRNNSARFPLPAWFAGDGPSEAYNFPPGPSRSMEPARLVHPRDDAIDTDERKEFRQ